MVREAEPSNAGPELLVHRSRRRIRWQSTIAEARRVFGRERTAMHGRRSQRKMFRMTRPPCLPVTAGRARGVQSCFATRGPVVRGRTGDAEPPRPPGPWRPVRIVFVLAAADLSGGVRTIATYAERLRMRGHRVTVVSAPPPAPTMRQRARALVREGRLLRSEPRGPSHLDGLPVEHLLLDRYRAVLDGDLPDADVVVATWWITAEWVAALSPRKGAKVHFIQGHDLETPGQPRERVRATWRLPLRRIVCSRWLAELACEDYEDGEARLVPNGVDASLFDSPPRSKGLVPTVGFVYAPQPIKGCDVAIAALVATERRLPGLKVVAFSSSAADPALSLPSHWRFFLRPLQRDIPRIYASCDAWLWPSHREGFGLPILEAMACRTPVVATRAGAAPDILKDGGGILVPASDPVVMAEALARIVTLPALQWQELSSRARQVAKKYDWNRSTDLFELALQDAAAGAW
jgi:glycosyltransferase involved in cell wall biosynthesis